MTPKTIFLLIVNASLLISINTDSICSLKVLRSLRTVFSMLSFIDIATPNQIGFVYVFLQHYNFECHTNHTHHLLTKSLLYQSMKNSCCKFSRVISKEPRFFLMLLIFIWQTEKVMFFIKSFGYLWVKRWFNKIIAPNNILIIWTKVIQIRI